MVELAIIVPTLNERGNVPVLIERLEALLTGVDWEVIFVDDNSGDGTPQLVRHISQSNPRVRGIERIGRRGLASACIEGMLATAAPYLAVMDADLQHDESILPSMLARLKRDQLDIVVGSRFVEGGSVGEFAQQRLRLSQFGTMLSRMVCKQDLRDPMSGFFIVTRAYFDSVVYSLSGIGFKILLDLIASSPRPVALAEVPYQFRQRTYGETKLDSRTLFEYLYLIADKTVGGLIPVQFLIFGLVGFIGLGPFLLVLSVLLKAGSSFLAAQVIATFVAMTLNYVLNNIWTYRTLKLTGRKFWIGLATFYGACSLGALLNIQFAQYLLGHGLPWYLAGVLGILVGWVWNYCVTSMVTWRRARHEKKDGLQRAALIRTVAADASQT